MKRLGKEFCSYSNKPTTISCKSAIANCLSDQSDFSNITGLESKLE